MEKAKMIWVQNGGSFNRVQGPIEAFDSIPRGIYKVEQSRQGFYLSRVMDKFEFSFKLYGLQTEFINYVIESYNKTEGNFGILLNGTKGTGKTVTAKVLANKIELPIIIIQTLGNAGANQDMMNWLSTDIDFDCVFFFDEYEKTFGKDNNILSFMDGVYNQNSRKIFLLTTNTLDIDENLLNRPSRVRYLRSFGNLAKETVSEYLDDTLEDKSIKKEVMDFVDTLQISTIDILKSIVQEINIHGYENFKKFKNSFNVQTESYTYDSFYAYKYITGDDEARMTTIDDFWKLKTKYVDNRMEKPYSYEFKKADGSINQNAFRGALEKYKQYLENNFSGYKEFFSTESDIKYQDLKKGDVFGEFFGDGDPDNDIIVDIDRKRNVIVTLDANTLKFHWIKNPDAKPSIYGGKKAEYVKDYGYVKY